MTSYRYRTTGQGTPWIVATGYRNQSNPNARLVRNDDSPPFWLGLLVLIAGLGAIVATVLLISTLINDPPAASPDAHALASSGTPPSHASSVSAHGQPGAGR